MNYTVIVPFYNEAKNIPSFNNELIDNLKKIDNGKRNLEIIYVRSEEHTSELQSRTNLVCRLLLEKKKKKKKKHITRNKID